MEKLPTELVYEICYYCNYDDIINLCYTSKTNLQLNTAQLWTDLAKSKFNITKEIFETTLFNHACRYAQLEAFFGYANSKSLFFGVSDEKFNSQAITQGRENLIENFDSSLIIPYASQKMLHKCFYLMNISTEPLIDKFILGLIQSGDINLYHKYLSLYPYITSGVDDLLHAISSDSIEMFNLIQSKVKSSKNTINFFINNVIRRIKSPEMLKAICGIYNNMIPLEFLGMGAVINFDIAHKYRMKYRIEDNIWRFILWNDIGNIYRIFNNPGYFYEGESIIDIYDLTLLKCKDIYIIHEVLKYYEGDIIFADEDSMVNLKFYINNLKLVDYIIKNEKVMIDHSAYYLAKLILGQPIPDNIDFIDKWDAIALYHKYNNNDNTILSQLIDNIDNLLDTDINLNLVYPDHKDFIASLNLLDSRKEPILAKLRQKGIKV